MHEKITKLIPSTKERLKPEKPADVIDIETARTKRKQLREIMDMSSVLTDAFDLVREGQLSGAEIDNLRSINENEKTLLKVIAGLFEKLRKQDKTVDELRARIKNLEQGKEDEQ
jgi:hypothetical protein